MVKLWPFQPFTRGGSIGVPGHWPSKFGRAPEFDFDSMMKGYRQGPSPKIFV